MRLVARFFGILFILIFSFFITKTSYAQTPQGATQPTSSIHNFSQNVMIEVFSAFACQLTGIDFAKKTDSCLGIDSKTGQIGYVKNTGGAIGTIANATAYLFNPPVHTADFIAYTKSNFGIVKNANAQIAGNGLNQLHPIVGVWVLFRNLTYVIFVIVFIFIGVGIMFRRKIDPRTVMTVQNQVPKIIISLLLITMSLAIAGFLIDVMWVSTYFVIKEVSSVDPSTPNAGTLIGGQIYNNPLSLSAILFGKENINWNAAQSIGDVVSSTINPSTNTATPPSACDNGGIPILCNLGDLFASTLGSVLNAIWAGLISFIVGIVAFLIISIAILWSLIKLWFGLLRAFISILINITVGPFWIIAGLIPGQETLGFGNWVRELMGNLMAFPAVIALFLLGKIIIDGFGSIAVTPTDSTSITKIFVPPLIGGVQQQDKLGALIGLGIILASPHVVDTVKKAFKAQNQNGLGAVSTGLAAAGALGGAIGSRLYYRNPTTGDTRGPVAGLAQSATQRISSFTPVKRITTSISKSRIGQAAQDPAVKKARQEARENAQRRAEILAQGNNGPSNPPPPPSGNDTGKSSGGSTA